MGDLSFFRAARKGFGVLYVPSYCSVGDCIYFLGERENRNSYEPFDEPESLSVFCFHLSSKEMKRVADIRGWAFLCEDRITAIQPLGNDRLLLFTQPVGSQEPSVLVTTIALDGTILHEHTFPGAFDSILHYLGHIFLLAKSPCGKPAVTTLYEYFPEHHEIKLSLSKERDFEILPSKESVLLHHHSDLSYYQDGICSNSIFPPQGSYYANSILVHDCCFILSLTPNHTAAIHAPKLQTIVDEYFENAYYQIFSTAPSNAPMNTIRIENSEYPLILKFHLTMMIIQDGYTKGLIINENNCL